MNPKVKKLTTLGMLAAIAYVVMLVGRFPLVLFLSYDPKDVVIVIAGFLYGPMSSFLISAAVSLVEMFTVSDTGLIGCVMNILSTCSFACTAAFPYTKHRSLKGAVAGLIAGVAAMVAVMLLWNYLITPLYMETPRQVVAQLLLPAFLPFNLIKGGLNAAIAMLLYKPVVGALRRSRLLPPAPEGQAGHIKPGVMLVAAVVLITFVLLALVLAGVI